MDAQIVWCDRQINNGSARRQRHAIEQRRLRWVIADVDEVAGAEFTRVVIPPARGRAIIQQRAGHRASRLHRHDPGSTEVDLRDRTHFAECPTAVGDVTKTQLTEIVQTPTVKRGVIEDRAGVLAAGRHRHNTAGQIDRHQGISHRVEGSTAVDHITGTELTEVVLTPAERRGVVEQHAGVLPAR